MNLWLRLFWLLATSRWRPPIAAPAGVSVLHFRVWFNDLDAVGHMNNGRYLTLMDLGRTDFMIGTGLWRALLKHKWTPIANAIVIRFRREMRLLQKFRLETRLLYWDETRAVMEQVFVFDGGPHAGHVAARALFKGGLYDRSVKKFVPVSRLMDAIGVAAASPEMSAEAEAFLASDEALRQTDRS